ncbi:MAG: hypothetical protein HYU51_18890 [Candidatus Rokubacteria bacterium]|nr:hypothetical protein [Candidatus Rokubacteria bacterium]
MDVRDGLQMECIHCAQCIDACETVMTKLGRPRGLIRHSSRAELQGEPRRWLRPRLVFYPVLLVLVLGALTVALARRAPADVTVLRGSGSPFVVLPSGEVSNQVRIKIANRSREHRRYLIDLAGADSIRLIAPENPLGVAAGKTATATVFVAAPRAAFAGGQRDIGVRVSDGAGFSSLSTFRLLGPSDGGRS